MKKFTIICLVIGMVGGISPTFARGRQEAGTTTLRVIHYAGGGVDFWETINESFMKEYPEIVVEQEIVQPGQYHQRLGGYVTTGRGPDIALMEAGTSTFMYRNVLMDLKGKFDHIIDDITGLDIYFDDFRPDRPLLAIPTATNGHMVYYNKRVFVEAGLDPENPPRTFSEMQNAVDAIRAIGKEPIALGAREYGTLWLGSAVLHQVMSAQQQQDIYTSNQRWTEGELFNFVKVLEEIWQRGWINRDAGSTTVTPEAQDMFINGDAAFFVSLIGDAFNWKVWGDTMGYENVGAMLFPRLEEGDIPGVSPSPLADSLPLWGSYAFGILSWSENVEAAVTYISYLLRPDIQERFVLEGGFFPNNFNSFNPNVIEHEIFAELFEWASVAEAIPGLFYWQPQEWDAYMRNSQMLFSNMVTAQEYASEMQRAHDQ